MPGSLCQSSGFSDLPPGGERGTARASTSSRAAGREQGTATAEQVRAALEGVRERGMDAELGRVN